MKPGRFAYLRPYSVEEALDLLAEGVEDTRILAGGQSLVPMMNLRLARPNRLIDVNRLSELSGIRSDGKTVHVGALTRHVDLERCDLSGPLGNLVRQTASFIGHLPIRVRGTFGGSLAHADPSSEWCLLAHLLDATAVLRSREGTRRLTSEDFFVSYYTTALAENEILTEVILPVLSGNHRTNVVEFARQPGDFAIVVVLSDISVLEGAITKARICIGGVCDRPHRSLSAESVLVGDALRPNVIHQAADAAAEELEPIADINGSSSYRRHLVRTLVRRALEGGVTP